MRVRMPRAVKSVTIVGPVGRVRGANVVTRRSSASSRATEDVDFTLISPDGRITKGVVQIEASYRRSSSKGGRRMRRLVRKEHKALGYYLELHDRSNRRRKNGWFKDLPRNAVRAIRHGLR